MSVRKEVEEIALKMVRQSMINPPHVGEVIRNEILVPLKLNVRQAADKLGVSRPNFNNMLLGKQDLSLQQAILIEQHFGVNFELLLRMQLAYKIYHARKTLGETLLDLKQKKEKADGQED